MTNEQNPTVTNSDLPDLVEPIFDDVSDKLAKDLFGIAMPELVKDIPIIKYFKTAGDVYSSYRVYKLHKRMKAFLESLIAGLFQIDDFLILPTKEQQLIVDILVTELDSQTDDVQSEALALLFEAYIRKDIDKLLFHGIAHELKNTNPLTFYFNMEGFTVQQARNGIRIIEGSPHYLSSAFYANRSDMINFSSDLYLTNLGEAFFKYIYEPMRKKYSI